MRDPGLQTSRAIRHDDPDRPRRPFAASLCALLLAAAGADAAPQARRVAIPGTSAWELEINNPRFDRESDAKLAPYLGRQALWLRANTHVLATGAPFASGTIEFDVVPMQRSDFIAVMFRRTAYAAQENIYFRPPKSGRFDAMQYAPRVNSSTWQLYGNFNVRTEWPRDAWTHIRIEVDGAAMQVFVNDATEPVLDVPRLRGETEIGEVGFWSRVNFENDTWSAAISNVTVVRREATTTVAPALDESMLNDWEISDPFQPGHDAAIRQLPEADGWRAVQAEERGLVNLNRLLGRVGNNGERWTTLARTWITSATARVALLNLGYTDEVTVFLNGEPLYSGRNTWESRYPRYLGLLGIDQERVYLRLRPGDNELVLAVSDDQRFGWGFAAKIEE